MDLSKLVLMDIGLFCEGMYIKSRIYYLYGDNYVLLCKNAVITKTLMERLENAARGTDGVFIEEEHYEDIWNESLRQHSLDSSYKEEYIRTCDAYNHVLSKTVSFLGEVSPRSRIPLDIAQDIAETIADDLYQLDEAMMLHCINMIQQADNYLYTHCVNVATLNGMVGKWMKLPEEEVRRLIKTGLVHDLGKLQIPPKVLNKPGRLTADEFELIKKHPIYSYEMLLKSGERDLKVLMGVRQHHEHFDGSGYPNKLTGLDISLNARITCLCDIYDAMVSRRCYKEASSPFDILAEFKENKFPDLDLDIVNIFLDNITYLFIGTRVRLSNGEDGEVVFIRPSDYANPVVKVGNRVFPTNKNCRCLQTVGQKNGITGTSPS